MKQNDAELAKAVAAWSGFSLEGPQLIQLERYESWLREEALPGGLIGPREGNRIWARHIADSLVFAVGWDGPPEKVVDIGTGAGLPGIPLAVLWPECNVTLVDRSRQRGDVLLRLTRVLDLGNADVLVSEAHQVSKCSGLVMRAVLPPPEAVRLSAKLLAKGGTAVLGWSRSLAVEEARSWPGAVEMALRTRTIPSGVLDESPTVLIMTARG